MAIPSKAELLKKLPAAGGTGALAGITRDNVLDAAQKRTATRDRDINNLVSGRRATAEASRSLGSRFLEELGITAKEIGQGTARSFVGVGQLAQELGSFVTEGKPLSDLKKVTDRPYVPESSFEKKLVGDRPVSIRSTGDEYAALLKKIGISDETSSKLVVPLGLFMSALDVVPGAPGKKKGLDALIDTVAKTTAGTADETVIRTALNEVVKGDDETVRALSEALIDIDNASDAAKLIRASLKTSDVAKAAPSVRLDIPETGERLERLTVPPALQRYAETISTEGLTKSEFLARLGNAVDDTVDEARSLNAIEFMNDLKAAGFTPGRFYDAARGVPVPQSGGIAGKTGLRKVGLSPEEKMIARPESALLRDRVEAISKGAAQGFRAGAAATRREVLAIQKEVSDLARNNLPPYMRGALLVTVRNANRPSKLEAALRTVEERILDYNTLRAQSKRLSTARSRIGFIRKVAQLNQTAVNDAKRAVGIEKSLRSMTEPELKRLSDELIKRLKFKKELGLIEPTSLRPRDGALTEEQIDSYAAAMNGAPSWAARASRSVENTFADMDALSDLVSIPSEALRAIGAEPVLTELRRMGHNARMYEKQGTDILDKVVKKLGLNSRKRAISDRDFLALDLAMKNGAIDTVQEIAEKYGVWGEMKALRTVLDDVHKRANETGLEVEYRRNFFPRNFKQDAATRREALEYFERTGGGALQEAYAAFKTRMGRDPNSVEKWKMLSNLMMGFTQQGITLSKTGSFKRRVVESVTDETGPFYADSFSSLAKYLESANNLVESRRFFGRHIDIKKMTPEDEMTDWVGPLVDKLLTGGKIKPDQVDRLSEILKARFTGGQMNGWLRAWKNTSYLTIMGDIFSAATQIGDFEKVMYRSGLQKAAPAIFRAVFSPSAQEVRLGDLGFERTVAQEMSTADGAARTVASVFRAAGLTWIDRLGKEAFINGTLSRYRDAVAAGDERFLAVARRVLGKEADETFQAISRGENTENVKFLLANELADYFPVTLEEVPIAYLRYPNGRVFYTMKTFTTKQLNTYRREIFREYKTNPVQAARNMARLVGFFIVMNMTSDEIKSFIKDEEDKEFSDKLVDNMLKVVGFNRYSLDQTQRQGLFRTLVETALPPTTFADDAVKDFIDVFSEDGLDKGARSTRNVPLGGELYYWWFGRGAQQNQAPAKKGRPAGEVPTIEIPAITIPEITI